MKNIRHASGKAPHVVTMKDREAVAHPGVMAVALFDTRSVSTWSVEAVQNPRRLYVLFTTRLELNTLTRLWLRCQCKSWRLILYCLEVAAR